MIILERFGRRSRVSFWSFFRVLDVDLEFHFGRSSRFGAVSASVLRFILDVLERCGAV